MPKKFKHYASFSSAPIRCVFDKEKNRFLSTASVEDLKAILPPGIVENGWEDLLPIAGNACVVNLANKNRDAIDTPTAIAIAQYFVRKYINVEHDRNFVVGVIESASFSKFDSNYMTGAGSEPLSEADASQMTAPFNLAIAGYLWKVVAPAVTDKVVECNNPDSPDFLTLSISWELGFDDYCIAVGPQNINECKIISDPTEVEAMSKYLVQEGGPGQLDDGTPVYRLVSVNSNAVPLGIGLTFSPAAAVAGVVTPEFEAKASENKENSSQSTTTPVITTKETKLPLSMKVLKNLNDLRGLNDENAKEYSFANIQSVLDPKQLLAEVDVASKVIEYQNTIEAERQAKLKAEQDAKDAIAKATKEVEDIKKQNEELANKFAALEKKQSEAEATVKFNERMQSIDESYDLDDNMRQSVAESIRGLSDEAYAGWVKNFANIAHKSKKVAPAPAVAPDPEKVAKDALAAAKRNEAAASALPNNPTATPSLMDRMRASFTPENVKVTANSARRGGTVTK